jgi:hypothetical protein
MINVAQWPGMKVGSGHEYDWWTHYMSDAQSAYDELYVYTMGRGNFILQHVVDAQQAQTATQVNKPMGIVFSLVGLYLHVEKGFTGAEVQKAHQKLARQKQQWPTVQLPQSRGSVTAMDVMAAPAGTERDAAIDRWCETVWKAFSDSRDVIVRVVADNVIA